MRWTRRPVSVLVVDDHRLMREGTAALLRADERVEVAGLARDGREALALAQRRAPDVVLLDLDMPELGGLETCAALRERHPDIEVLILTVSERDDDLYAALRLGAAGYLLKDMPPRELVQAVLEAGRGEPRIAPRLARRMLAELGARTPGPPTRWPSSARASARSSGWWPRACATARSPSGCS